MPPTYWRKAQVSMMFKKMGVAITVNGVTVVGIVDRTDEELLRGGYGHLIGRFIVVRVETDTLPDLEIGALLDIDPQTVISGGGMVGSEVYRASRVLQEEDGAVTVIVCAKN